ncbi:ABC transporter ATP-binding protein [Nocardia sp. NPDC051750]|uniref:ABC transporter ATP-binding protein n=1 Tax=Nocardia sp. NPDC051750 TaxID=3364325 RepID=UPI0037B41CF8
MGLANTMRDSDARTLTKGTAVSFDRVIKRFGTGTTALDGIDLRVRHGDFVAVVGPSGCGKSTLLRMAAGLDRPSAGSVAVATESIGFIFQEPTLLPWRSVRRNVELSAELAHLDKAARRSRAAAAIRAVGLDDFAEQLPRTLSGGMKMRASLARALTLAPEVMLLDEPFGALDEMTRLDMQVELQRLYTDKQFTAMFITHSVSEAVFLANRVVVLTPRPGRIADMVDIDFPYPRGPELRYDPRFTDYVSQLSASLHGGTR